MIKMGTGKLAFVAFLFLIQITTQVLADCTCEPEEKGKKSEALKYKLIALASILVAGAVGVCLPFIGRIVPSLSPEKDGFFIIKAFAAGVILATGFIHVLPDAFDNLTCSCLIEKYPAFEDFPFTGFIAMVATMLTLLFETSSASYHLRSHESEAPQKLADGHEDEEQNPRHMGQVAAHTHATHGHAHGAMPALTQVDRYKIVSKVLELGIIVHSVVIGLSLGASESPKTIKPLVVALTFHQFFEGIGLGGCIFQQRDAATQFPTNRLILSHPCPSPQSSLAPEKQIATPPPSSPPPKKQIATPDPPRPDNRSTIFWHQTEERNQIPVQSRLHIRFNCRFFRFNKGRFQHHEPAQPRLWFPIRPVRFGFKNIG